MDGMSMPSDPASCKVSMLWNWYTIDSCFLSETWHVHSAGTFAGSCIGVIFLVIALELIRRAQREFDGYLHRRRLGRSSWREKSVPMLSRDSEVSSSDGVGESTAHHHNNRKFSGRLAVRPGAPGARYGDNVKLWQHIVRCLLYTLQFAVAYVVMLLAMSFNGYIIFMIFVGAFLGAFIFQWDMYSAGTRRVDHGTCG